MFCSDPLATALFENVTLVPDFVRLGRIPHLNSSVIDFFSKGADTGWDPVITASSSLDPEVPLYWA